MAQQWKNENSLKFRLDIGLGISLAGAGPETSTGGALAGRAAAHFEIHRIILTVPVTIMQGGESNYNAFFGGNLRDEFSDLSLLIGYSLNEGRDLQLVASAGLSRVSGSRVIYNPDDDCWMFCSDGSRQSIGRVIGVPVEFGIYSRGDSPFGLAFVSHINFNPEEIFAGFTINLMLGNRD